MDQLMVSFQHWAGSADEGINLFLVGGKNCSWQLYEGHDGTFDGLGSKIGPKPSPRYHWKALIKGFRLENYTLLISKVKNVARSYRFGGCPD
jgi:hypothetical protein